MAKRASPSQIILDSLKRRDPSVLAQLVPKGLTQDELLKLQSQIENVVIKPVDFDLLFKWMWHRDTAIARAVRTILLFLDDPTLRVELFTRLSTMPEHKVPFIIKYNEEEQEFSIELRGTPSWGVSHYGREDPQTDRLLEALERLYRKIPSGYIPPYFRS